MAKDRQLVVDLRSVSKDTRVLLRWVARQECAMDDDDRCQQDLDALVGVDDDLLRRVVRKMSGMKFRVTAEEARCLHQIVQSAEDRLGAANLKDVDALMEGDDDAYLEPYPYLPDQPDADEEEQGEELDRLLELLSANAEPQAAR
jgi:hypothetical protein